MKYLDNPVMEGISLLIYEYLFYVLIPIILSIDFEVFDIARNLSQGFLD